MQVIAHLYYLYDMTYLCVPFNKCIEGIQVEIQFDFHI